MYKIGIIGPKPFLIGGHCINNSYRKVIRERINDILKNQISEHKMISGITGLNLGLEQDFAQCCLDNNIDYITYLPYKQIIDHWSKLPPNITDRYSYYLDKSLRIEILSQGFYSPKKILLQREKIIKDCSVVLFMKHKFDNNFHLWKEMSEKFETKLIEI